MEETDLGRLLAAAAPDTVPPVGDLPGRARTLGKRRRARRAAMTGGGTALAVVGVFGAVAVFGGFGNESGQQSSATFATNTTSPPPSDSSGTVKTVPPTSPTTIPTTTPGFTFPKNVDDPVADAKVTEAVKAALPAADRDKPNLYRAGGTPGRVKGGGYGAEYNWGPRSDEEVFSAAVAPYDPTVHGTPSSCAMDPHHCTTGTTTLRGDQVSWEYYYGDQSSPSFTVNDAQAKIGYLFTADAPNKSAPLGLTEMKDVGLNEQVAAALLAAWPGH